MADVRFINVTDSSPARAQSPRSKGKSVRVAADQELRGRATPPRGRPPLDHSGSPTTHAAPPARPGTSGGGRPGTGSRRPGSARRPGTSGARRRQAPTELRRALERGDLPVVVETCGTGRQLIWRAELHAINYEQLLPVFFSGLTERGDPARFIAREGALELLEACPEPARVLSVLPQLVKLLKTALNTREPPVVSSVLYVLQQLAVVPGAGEALAAHYRQVLPCFSLFRDKHGKSPIADLIQETLELLEAHGPDDACEQIHRVVPSYSSCFA